MRVYTVHLQSRSPVPDRNAILIREGFCWPAFLFGPAWALVNRMWFTAAGLAGAYALLALGASLIGMDGPVTATVFIGGAAIVGFCANDWRRAALDGRGWRMSGLAAAADRDTALRRFIDLHPEALNPPATPRSF